VKYFADTHELLRFARAFLDERLESLQRDVALCLGGTHAPFPALLYFFSTVDLLGALSAGNASRNAPTSRQAKASMRRFMHYSEEQCDLLLDIFRHKIVHLAQPSPVVEHYGRKLSWGCWHNERGHHLQLISLPQGTQRPVTSIRSQSWTHRFEVSITHLVKDLVDSVYQPGGYLHLLSQDADLQDKFDT
jgi:hypothetical protein